MIKQTFYRLVAIQTFLALLIFSPLSADDTCIFSVTADDMPPNIVLLLDSGAEMEQIVTHSGYSQSADYTPTVATENDGVNGFFNDLGYIVDRQNANTYYLRPIDTDLTAGSGGAQSDNANTWTINGRTINLPKAPLSTAVDGVIDNANQFRYSKNYLNYLFFGSYAGTGADLPNYTRFYMAKKAILQVAKITSNKAKFGLYNFVNDSGASSVQPLKMVVDTLAPLPANNTLDSAFVNNVNNMGTGNYSPLAEGLSDVGTYFASPSAGLPTIDAYCQKNFIIVVSAGVSSEDQNPGNQGVPDSLTDFDGDSSGIGEGTIQIGASTYTIPVNINGSTYLDDFAKYLYDHDVPGYVPGFQNILTYTVGVMTTDTSKAYLINTSNNGNGKTNLYDTTDPDYGKYHFDATSPSEIATALETALDSILSRTATFTAPVVPVTRTTSGDLIYLAFFKPLEGNFWEGNITKFGLTEDNAIVDKNSHPATWPNGAMKDTAEAYWNTIDWADPNKSNYMANGSRNIYTYFGNSDLTDATNTFATTNAALTAAVLGNPTAGSNPEEDLINFIRGADVFDEDADSNTTENRSIITGDALHVEPVVFNYTYQQGASPADTASSFIRIFFGANDGMLHAVKDSDGTEAWGFIPPGQLTRLKQIIEGPNHEYFLDSSPKVYFHDLDKDGYIDDVNSDGMVDVGTDDRVILVFGERKGGSSYYALDVTYPDSPVFLWHKSSADYSELGETWSEPKFGKVKTTDVDTTGTPVLFVGGGYSSGNTAGRAVFLLDAFTGALVKYFANTDGTTSGMDYSIISNITLIDADNNGFTDKAYVGDMGGNLWRLGYFPSAFPLTDENANNWEAQILFSAGCDESDCSDSTDNDGDGLTDERRQFQYAPDVTLEWGYDLLLIGSGDREIACEDGTADRIYAVKDNHISTGLVEEDLVNVNPTAGTPPVPNLDNTSADVDANNSVDVGWYYPLADGEKALAEGLVFNKVLFITTFLPNNDPCVPGGASMLYGLGYKTGAAGIDFDGDGSKDASTVLGGGIGSKPVIVIHDTSTKMLVSVGSTNPDATSESTNAGVVTVDPNPPTHNIFFIWWQEIFD
jgi:type IV pilus assembly protein PilY1